MAKFKCWNVEQCGKTEDDAVILYREFPERAAESYVHDYEWQNGEYAIARGDEMMTVNVRRLDDGVLFKVLVSGVAVPTYSGQIIKTIPKA